MPRKKRVMDSKRYQQYLDYLCKLGKYSNWVLRDNPYPEYFQFPCDKQNTFEEIEKLDAYEIVIDALSTLTERERKILLLRFGFIDHTPLTLQQVGDIMHVSREIIRAIEGKALRKLRHPNMACLLKLVF